jgi:hypothetical protein
VGQSHSALSVRTLKLRDPVIRLLSENQYCQLQTSLVMHCLVQRCLVYDLGGMQISH